MKIQLLMIVAVFLGVNLNAQEIKIPASLKDNSEVYNVKGRYGIQINQEISFGSFHTSKIKKGWTKATTVSGSGGFFLPNSTEYKNASQKFNFEQYYGEKLLAKVNCTGKLSTISYEVVKDFFAIGTDFKNVFTGIIIPDNDSIAWNLIVNNPDQMADSESGQSGAIIKKNETAILIYGVSELEGKKIPKLLQTLIGFLFVKDGEPIGAVSLYNKGVVTIGKDIDNELKLVIAAASTSLLVRERLDD